MLTLASSPEDDKTVTQGVTNPMSPLAWPLSSLRVPLEQRPVAAPVIAVAATPAHSPTGWYLARCPF